MTTFSTSLKLQPFPTTQWRGWKTANSSIDLLEMQDPNSKSTPTTKRTLAQNKFYWKIVVPIVCSTLTDHGWDRSTIIDGVLPAPLTYTDTHNWLKANFALGDSIQEDGIVLGMRIMSTTEMTKERFSTYVENIRQWAAEYMNTDIPDPQLQYEL